MNLFLHLCLTQFVLSSCWKTASHGNKAVGQINTDCGFVQVYSGELHHLHIRQTEDDSSFLEEESAPTVTLTSFSSHTAFKSVPPSAVKSELIPGSYSVRCPHMFGRALASACLHFTTISHGNILQAPLRRAEGG